MSVLKASLIGTGRVGFQFDFNPELPDNHASAVQAVDGVELVAGVNRGREKLDAFGQRFGVQALYHDYGKMLDEVRPEICIIATHPELHCEMVETCAAAPSTKAIICEKPMALSLGECDRMIAACERADVLLQVNHNRRYAGEWNLAKKLLDDGALGTFNHIYCFMDGVKPAPWWRHENEGPLIHDFTHYTDLMDLYAGEVDWLCGMAEQRRRPWAVEDFSAAFMKFRNGVSGVIHASELSEYTNLAFELRGTTGVLRMEQEKVQLYQAEECMYEPDSGFQWKSPKLTDVEHAEPSSSYVTALRELLGALDGKATLRSDGRVGRRSLEMVMAIYQSQLSGCTPVQFPVELKLSGVEELRRAGQFVEREEGDGG